MAEGTGDQSLKTLRGFLFAEMIKIRNGSAVVSESVALTKLSAQVINSYKVEIDTVRVANDLRTGNEGYADKLEALRNEQPEV